MSSLPVVRPKVFGRRERYAKGSKYAMLYKQNESLRKRVDLNV